MTRFFQHPWGWTSIAPLVCAIHCLATPLLVAVAPSVVVGPQAEWALLGLTVVLVIVALIAGLRSHRDLRPAPLLAAGLAVWVGSLLHVFHPLPEEPVTAVAALVVATGLVWNSRLVCAHREVSCTACETARDEAASLSAAPAEAASGTHAPAGTG
jgi:hypothetical protein